MGFFFVSNCYACESMDSMDHCFAQCPLMQKVWFFCEEILQVLLLQQSLYQTFHFCWHHDLQIGPGLKRLISVVPLAVCWGIWWVKNSFIFNNVHPTLALAINYAVDVLRSISLLKPFIFPSSSASVLHRLGGPLYSGRAVTCSSFILGKTSNFLFECRWFFFNIPIGWEWLCFAGSVW